MTRTFREIFKEKGISPSYTRTRVYSFLEQAKNHPTADDIYQELSPDLPTLSKTTVYNVLKLFCEHNLVKPVNMSSNEMRYELYQHPHSHFRCTECGEIYDIPFIKPAYDTTALAGFVVNDEEVNLSGVCPTCLHKN